MARTTRVLGPYREGARWRLVLYRGGRRTSRKFATRAEAERVKAELVLFLRCAASEPVRRRKRRTTTTLIHGPGGAQRRPLHAGGAMSPQSLSHPDQRLRGNPDIAVAYLRTATGTEGLVAQRATLSAWAEKHGVRIVEWCEDVASSGLTELKDRPGLRAALAALSRHQAGHLAIARRDRLSRDVLLAACFEQIVFRAGAIVSMPDPG